MKKLYILTGALLGVATLNAQINVNSVSARHDRNDHGIARKAAKKPKVEGQIYWTNGFDVTSEWAQTTGPAHTSGDWQILSAIPANITSQQAGYQWPATFQGASGNFAFINSDDAGQTAAQDAYFGYTGSIDLSAAGNAPLYLSFAEYYRHFLEEFYVEVSVDGGTNWTTFQVNPESEVPVNTNCVPGEVEVVNITAAKGANPWTNTVKVRFHYVGQWDWFWGIDDVKIVEAWNNDMKVTNWYQATDLATTFGLDYYHIPASQSSFPGMTFGAKVLNNGGANQPAVTLAATATGGYVGASAALAINSGATDTLSISAPYIPTGIGTKTINLTTSLGANTDSDNSNNTETLEAFMTNYEYSRDNNIQSGSISQISSQDAQPLKIGNVHEIFDPMDVTAVKVYLATQGSGAVGSEYFAELWRWNGVDAYEFLAETNPTAILNTTAGWKTLPIIGGPVTLNPGDDILAVAGHFGGDPEIRFGLAQPTFENTVLGFDANGDLFGLSSPNAVMIRLLDDPAASVEEMANNVDMNIYPNPANASAVVTFNTNAAAEASLTVTDLSGKVLYTTALGTVNGAQSVTVNTDAMSSGVYMVNLTVDGTVSTQKLIVRK